MSLIVEYNICSIKKNSKKNGHYIFTLYFVVFFQRVLSKIVTGKTYSVIK